MLFRDKLYVSDSGVVVSLLLVHSSLSCNCPALQGVLTFCQQRTWWCSWDCEYTETDCGELNFVGTLLLVEIWLWFELQLKYMLSAFMITSRNGGSLLLTQEHAGSCTAPHCCSSGSAHLALVAPKAPEHLLLAFGLVAGQCWVSSATAREASF